LRRAKASSRSVSSIEICMPPSLARSARSEPIAHPAFVGLAKLLRS